MQLVRDDIGEVGRGQVMKSLVFHSVDCEFIPQFISHLHCYILNILGFPGGSEGKASACNAGDLGSIPGSGRSPGEGNGNPHQSSCLGVKSYQQYLQRLGRVDGEI